MTTSSRLLTLLFAVAGCVSAQTADTAYFRTKLSTANEVPAVTGATISGDATIVAHYVRDASGEVISGSVDFIVTYDTAQDYTVTGLHIHSAAVGVNGPIVLDTGITAASPLAITTGRGVVPDKQVPVTGSTAAQLTALRGLLADPSGYYVNLHTTTNPAGIMRGQLQRAQRVVLMAQMSTANENPPITAYTASGTAVITALRTLDANGRTTSGVVDFEINYSFPEAVTFTGLHIHTGVASVNGPVTIGTPISGTATVPSDPSGSGRVFYSVEVNPATAAQVSTLYGIFDNPSALYVNMHTTVNPGGAIRSQLRATDRMRFPVAMLPSNEVPPLPLEASAPSFIDVHTLRAADGSIVAAKTFFDINHRFPGETTFTGLHIHDGVAGANGGVTVNTGITGAAPVLSATGFGNISRGVTTVGGAALATLNSMVVNPDRHYANLHTSVNTGGAVRAPMGLVRSGPPSILAIISAVSDPSVNVVAPAGMFTVFGTNLASVSTDPFGFAPGTSATLVNGVELSLGGRAAPLLFVSPTYVVAQAPVNTPLGSQPAILKIDGVASDPVNVGVNVFAPAVFFDAEGGIVAKVSDFTLIRAGNPARSGDNLIVYATGLGQTTPALETGRAAPASPQADTAVVTATLGGQNAPVISSVATPGLVGLYYVTLTTPSGVAPGNAALVLRIGGVASNTVRIAVQ